MKNQYEVVMGSLRDAQWHVGVYKHGNCLAWESFPSRTEAEEWAKNPDVPSPDDQETDFTHN